MTADLEPTPLHDALAIEHFAAQLAALEEVER